MASGDLLSVHPRDLKFPFELRKQSSCSMQLTNRTDKYVAFKVKTTNPKKYCVRPNSTVLSPGEKCNVTVTMQAQKEAPPDMQSKDKFLIQSVTAPYGATAKDIKPGTFNKEDGKVVEEFKLRVIYIPANPPSPVPEEPEEVSSPTAYANKDGKNSDNLFDAVTSSFMLTQEKKSEAWATISKLTEEKATVLQQNQRLHQELDLSRIEVSKTRLRTSLLFAAIVGLLGILSGYVTKKWVTKS